MTGFVLGALIFESEASAARPHLPYLLARGEKLQIAEMLRKMVMPSQGVTRASIELGDHREPADALVLVGVEERVIVLEGYAAVGLAGAAEHEGVREQAVAAENLLFAADRIEPQRRHAVEQRLARLQIVDVRRCHALHPHMRVARIVHLRAEA